MPPAGSFAPPRRVPPRSHTPSGAPSWPRLLLSGPTGSWKSATAARLSADDRIGGMFWLEIGDGEDTAEEYGRVPGFSYQVIDHDGTFVDIYDQLVAHYYLALDAEKRGDLPIALTVDSMGGLNTMLTEMGDTRAREKKVAADTKYNGGAKVASFWSIDYDATLTPELRALIKKRHAQFMRVVRNWPGPVTLLSGEDMATVFENGTPTDRKDWWLECRKDLPKQMTAHVRLAGGEPATVVKLRSAKQMLNPEATATPFMREQFSVAELVFDWIGCESGVSRAPADRVYDADQDMPDEVRVDRVGNRVDPGPTPEQLAERDRAARTLVRWLVEPGDVDSAARRATTAKTHRARDEDTLPYLDDEVRERLGIAPDAAELTLAKLGEIVVNYVDRHKRSALAPLDGPAPVDLADRRAS